ncbi:MAG: dienelactone hydrolase family protein, partial [Pseudomonadota bacterium]
GPYFEQLISLGFAVLCVEMPCFGARQEPNESSRSKAHLWHGTTLFGRMLHELRCGLTFLSEHPEIDGSRIGTMGISMGGTQAYWLAALDDRVNAAVSLCAFADLECLIASGNHDKHGHYMSVPGLLKTASTGQIAGLAAPRPLFVGVGMEDWSSPPDCFAVARDEVEQIYAQRSAPNSFTIHIESDAGHEETAAMRQAVIDFLLQKV